jgi:hypothetical protein
MVHSNPRGCMFLLSLVGLVSLFLFYINMNQRSSFSSARDGEEKKYFLGVRDTHSSGIQKVSQVSDDMCSLSFEVPPLTRDKFNST